jgi:hypothetical protein
MNESGIPIKKNPLVAFFLSVVPGLSHVYLGKVKKAIVLFIIDGGIILTLVYSESILMKILMINIYLFTFIPSALETYQLAQNKRSWISTDSKWYTVTLLLTTGFSALPLLWQNERFSKAFKILWTVLVPVLALCFFAVLFLFWDNIELFLHQTFR